MKLFLHSAIVLALIATSGVHGADAPNVLRGSVATATVRLHLCVKYEICLVHITCVSTISPSHPGCVSTLSLSSIVFQSNEVLAELGKGCNQGERDGKRDVQRAYGGDCANILGKDFSRRVKRSANRKYSGGRNFKQRAYNECAIDAVNKELRRVGKKCLNSGSGSDTCIELGEEAAKVIIRQSNVCPETFDSPSSTSIKKFRKTCRKVANGVCKGYIKPAQKQECPSYRMGLREQEDLQRKCKDMVNELTNDEDELVDAN